MNENVSHNENDAFVGYREFNINHYNDTNLIDIPLFTFDLLLFCTDVFAQMRTIYCIRVLLINLFALNNIFDQFFGIKF